jgi:coenzyme F420-0:L-glutamate ligase/coenzyme F420-1:gamma-L-glutamate ligase
MLLQLIMQIQIDPVKISSDIKPHDKLDVIILEATRRSGLELNDGDILVVAQKIVSKAEGRVIDLDKIRPSRKAQEMAKKHRKDPQLMEVILRESAEVLRAQNGIIVSETKHGFVCANAGVDQSNVQGNKAVLLPLCPDRSASKLKLDIKKRAGKDIAVIITDTFGRPFRNGQTNVAIGVAGIKPIKSYIGLQDMHGRKLKVTEIAIADEIASAAELVMGKACRIPVALVRGYDFEKVKKSSIKPMLRAKESDLFR